MASKPTTAAGYDRKQTALVEATCLYVATKLGDLMDDLVIVGGLVPTLLVPQEALPSGAERHVGTMDLDLGLSVLLLDHERYKTVGGRLRSAGFRPDLNDKGNPSRQRWVIDRGARVTVDFLIAPTLESDLAGRIRDLEQDFAAFIMPGLELAFEDQVTVTLSGRTLFGERATREVHVCGPGAYVVLKALAVRHRGENKDAYDLFYVVRNYGSGVGDIVQRLVPLLAKEPTKAALRYMAEDFSSSEDIGPMRTAEFLTGGSNADLQAEVFGFVAALVAAVRRHQEA